MTFRLPLLIAGAAALVASTASASQLVYRPINPSFGGDPLNGNWLLSQASAQSDGAGGPGFTIDFPDFGSIPQPPAPTDPIELPPVTPTNPAGQTGQ